MKDKSNAEAQAFPFNWSDRTTEHVHHNCLTKRELIAAMIVQGLCASKSIGYQVNDGYVACQPLVDDAIRITDELLKKLEE